MKGLFLIAMFFLTGVAFSQSVVLSNIPKTGKTITSFIPAGYDTIMTAKGDLNKDKTGDIVIVLKATKEDKIDLEKDDPDSLPRRLLLILFRKGTEFSLAGVADSAILCKYCGGIFGEPFEGVSVEKGILLIYHYGGSAWRWSYTHKFRFQNNDFFLIGKTRNSYWNVESCEKLGEFAGTDYEDINLITGAYVAKKVSEKGCKLLLNKKGKKPVAPLVKLSDFSIEN